MIAYRSEYVVLIQDGTLQVLLVCQDSSLVPTIDGATPIYGRTAGLLYEAITGHRFDQSPAYASPTSARIARALLQFEQRLGWPETILANQVIAQWGPYIRPWFGVCLFDEQTHEPKLGHPVYSTIILLANDKTVRDPDEITIEGRPHAEGWHHDQN